MKKLVTMILSTTMVLSLAACSSDPQEEASTTRQTVSTPKETPSASDSNAEGTSQEGEATTNEHILIAYFSVPETDGVDTVAGASRVVVDGEVLGNNQYVAQLIKQEVGGDLFRIETVQEYPGNHDALRGI